MLTTKKGIQLTAVASAITFLSISATALATSPSNCVEVTATNQQHMETGLAELCNFYYVCSTGDQEVLGYSWGSSSVETTLYTGESNLGYKTQPQECIIEEPGSCDATEQTLATLIDNGLAESCDTYYVCTTGDSERLGYSWLKATTKAEVFIGADELGYIDDPKNCAIIEEIDLAISLSNEAINVTNQETLTFDISVANIGTIDSSTANISAQILHIDCGEEVDCMGGGDISILSVNSSTATCTANNSTLDCEATGVTAGSNIDITVTALATHVGEIDIDFNVNTAGDTNLANNNAYLDISVSEADNRVQYEEEAASILTEGQIPHTENGAFTDNGRFFVASAVNGGNIYEITTDGAGNYDATPVVDATNNCMFTGLTGTGNTIYATCQSTSETYLYRLQVSDTGLDVIYKTISGLTQSNGMAVDANGDIYISDSGAKSLYSSKSPIIKVVVTDENTFEFDAADWLDKSYVIKFPNGIQIEGDTMYYADHYKVRTVKINSDGTAGVVNDFYTTTTANLIDDLAITPDYIAISEIKYPTSTSGSSVTGHVILLDKETGDVVQQIAADKIYEPSSIIYDRDGIFGEESLFVTDYFKSGLYEIKAETELPL